MAQFRTKARAVDLLGKGQIADLPTAITELWKNGYDAYADNLKAELYLENYNGILKPYFIISDDGKGMSQNDILDKWLVLGTDTKSRAQLEKEPSIETLWKEPRIKAGEKGIGRLSVAYLGNPMLMLTKKRGNALQAMFFDWRLLENYNLFLDDITIPIKEIESSSDFDLIFQELKDKFLDNFVIEKNNENVEIWENSQLKTKLKIINSTENAVIEDVIKSKLLEGIIDLNNDNGTKFLIFEPIPQILELPNKEEDDLGDRKFILSSLMAFTNPFREHPKIKVDTKFLVHDDKNLNFDLLTSQGDFFTERDYNLADVLIDGKFDGDGGFSGTVRIYNEKPFIYKYRNPRRRDSRKFYGEIPIKLGYSQGEERSTILDKETFDNLKTKISNYGGLYIFRDNFRVLPYGRANADFLGFEKRRSNRAGTYYFSYNRMFGYLDITRAGNPELTDKSSREGFINNTPFRAFVDDAQNFFIGLALEFFATNPKQNIFIDKKKILNEQYELLKSDKDREKDEKIAFTKALTEYPEKLSQYENIYFEILQALEEHLKQANIKYLELEHILNRIHTLDAEYNNLLPKAPKRYSPTDAQLDRLEKYETQFLEFQKKLESKKAPLLQKSQNRLDLKDLIIDFSNRSESLLAELNKEIADNKNILSEANKRILNEYTLRAEKTISEFRFEKNNLINRINSKVDLNEFTLLIDQKFNDLLNVSQKSLFPIVEHIKKLNFDFDEEFLQGAYKSEYEEMKKKWEQTSEMAQLGIAVEIIDHEFNHLYATINHSMDNLSNNDIFKSSIEFNYLTDNIKQLENKYELLSPLYRSTNSPAKDIQNLNIIDYLDKFFKNSIEGYSIKIEATPSFLNQTIYIKEPIIYTVYINIINNAIYWMRNSEKRVIKFDYLHESNEFVISNSGVKIENHRLEKIFQLFYSNRPNGRGIGLYLAKKSLNEYNYDIYATNDNRYNILNGACFVIKPLN